MSAGSSTIGGWNAAPFWKAITDSTSCAGVYLCTSANGDVPYFLGYQFPRTGNKFAASQFYCSPNFCPLSDRLYPRNVLKKPLKPNTAYCAGYFVVNTNNCVVGIDSYGIYFGGNSIDTISTCLKPITYLTPQVQYTNGIISDTLKWTAVTGSFVAAGGEKYMVLGNFKSNSLTNTTIINPTNLPTLSTDVLIDDVSLIELDLLAFAGRDTSVAPGDSVFLGRIPEPGLDELCIWYNGTSAIPIDTIAGFWINPVTTSTFKVRQEICGNVKWDTVVVYMDLTALPDIESLQRQIKIWPSPAISKVMISASTFGTFRDFKKISVFNCSGKVVFDCPLDEQDNIELDTASLQDGVYILELEGTYKIRKRFVVFHTAN